MKTLTVFTPAYNRKHTIKRTFESLCQQSCPDFDWMIIDDGSSDGTREWVESLGPKIVAIGPRYDWMGRLMGGNDNNHFVIETYNRVSDNKIHIEYIYKPNGGLYTGYNTAYASIRTELCVCIDSDDYMPRDAVEKIIFIWNNRQNRFGNNEFGGIVGLDFNVVDKKPIGGYFNQATKYAYFQDLLHRGDTKQVMRTDLMRTVIPQIGFEGEKDYNPYYLLMQICDQYPLLVTNDNFCWVEYQTTGDSMSAGIWKQYIRSPRSYAKYRIMQIQMKHGNDILNKLRLYVHYVSACILSKDEKWLSNSPSATLALLCSPLGGILSLVVRWKNIKK